MSKTSDDVSLSAQKIHKYFGGVKALEGASVVVSKNKLISLIGPNGSGKTTIIKLLLGLAKPTGGRAVVLGKPAGDQKARARIGYLP